MNTENSYLSSAIARRADMNVSTRCYEIKSKVQVSLVHFKTNE